MDLPSIGTRYRIEEKIAEGVFRASDERTGTTVALKLLSPGDTEVVARQRAIQRLQEAGILRSPHVIAIRDVADGYIAMEYVPGTTLNRLIPRDGLPLDRCLRWAGHIAEGVAAAHRAGVVHRDLKGSNVIIGDDGLARVVDFGLARIDSGPSSTLPGTVLGTVAYMSPEQASGRPADARADVFSFGAVLYEMLAGRRAFDAASVFELLRAIYEDPPPPLPSRVPPDLARLVVQCLEKSPDRRPQSMDEVVAGLLRVRDEGVLRRLVRAVSHRLGGGH